MVTIFTGFAPLGVVLVAMLGVGVADEAGFFNTGIKMMLNRTAKWLLTPVIVLVGLLSHSAIDAGYVLVIPLGGITACCVMMWLSMTVPWVHSGASRTIPRRFAKASNAVSASTVSPIFAKAT